MLLPRMTQNSLSPQQNKVLLQSSLKQLLQFANLGKRQICLIEECRGAVFIKPGALLQIIFNTCAALLRGLVGSTFATEFLTKINT